MTYHAIVEGYTIPAYSQSICTENALCGNLYNGEVFTFIKEHSGYLENYEVRFHTSSEGYSIGHINTGKYGNLVYSGTMITESKLDNKKSYRFKLRESLDVVNSAGKLQTNLSKEDYVYSRSATADESNKENMHIVSYKSSMTLSPLTILPVQCLLKTSVYRKDM